MTQTLFLFFFNDPATTEIYTLSLHDALPICSTRPPLPARLVAKPNACAEIILEEGEDGVAPGQACVFYAHDASGARVLGGGWIRAAYNLLGNAVKSSSTADAAQYAG